MMNHTGTNFRPMMSPLCHSLTLLHICHGDSCMERAQHAGCKIKLWFDKVGHQLIVTILGAKDLPSREDGRPRNPYVKIYFLPDRSDKNKRRTKTVKKTLEPKWNQTFIYSPVHRREFRERMLEITLWDQARVREEESEFLGEVPGSS